MRPARPARYRRQPAVWGTLHEVTLRVGRLFLLGSVIRPHRGAYSLTLDLRLAAVWTPRLEKTPPPVGRSGIEWQRL